MTPILFLLRSLNAGGAERQLIELVKRLDKNKFTVTVATFYPGGAFRPQLEHIEGVRLTDLQKKSRWDIISFLYRLWVLTKELKPRLVHGYMGTANELALLVGWWSGARVIWGLRASNVDFSQYSKVSAWLFRIAALLSRFPDRIIVNSWAGMKHHVAQGYSPRRMVVVPNGIDIARFHPCHAARTRMRLAWGVPENAKLIGLVARLDPMKDHPLFLEAASLLARERDDVRFVCVGGGPGPYSEKLRSLSSRLGLERHLIWAGHCADVPAVHNALDVATSSSSGEGFPNAIGEAMACGVPCVVTDVGDSAIIVGETGIVVPPGSPQELKAAWVRLLALQPEQRTALSQSCRRRILQEYGAPQLVRKTEAVLHELLGNR